MTVLAKYADLRARFAAGGAPLDADGFPVFPGPRVTATGAFSNVASTFLRKSGFSSTWTVTTRGGTVWTPTQCGVVGPLIAGLVPGGDTLFPLTVTINGGASDGGVDSYWWYLSQRSDNLRYVLANGTLSVAGQAQYLSMAHPDNQHSGTVVISQNFTQIAQLFPGSGGFTPTDPASLATLLAKCALYVSRQSDGAYQWATFTPT